MPDYPNGVISYYILRRNGLILANSTTGSNIKIFF